MQREILKSDRGSTYAGAMSGYVIGLIAGTIIANHTAPDSVDSEKLQLNNAEVQSQLSEQFSPVEQLLLTDDTHTFTFRTELDGEQQSCKGKYEIQQDIAKLAGPVACTQSITVSPAK